jgi:hypothetical protein
MIKKLKSLFKTETADTKKKISDKDQATAKGQPYINVMNVNIDYDNPSDGYFELEWNQVFVKQLLEAGFTGDKEEQIIDQWFSELCRNLSDSDHTQY